ncbi:MAG: hypothetical protein OXF74_07725 [Rhodobacteraceae bacterium]|nr:hypothetical protein [Paracoccaceae bacterium]
MTEKPQSAGTIPVAELKPSPLRRHFGIGALALLGCVLAYVSFTAGKTLPASMTLAIAAVLSVFVSIKMYAATRVSLLLSNDGIRTSEGELVAGLDNIQKVERGMFAFKPSNGFLLVLHSPMPRSWNPGMWWRFGRRIGIGGVTHRAEGKAMADAVTLLLQARDGD